MRAAFCVQIAVFFAALIVATGPIAAQRRIGDLCHVKGQEENTLHGLGLVVGLNGTGDGDARPTMRALAQMLSAMGNPLPRDAAGGQLLAELKDSKNVALVFVTATVPGVGAREGSRLNCQVSAISAKSLQGGYLMQTALIGPRADSPRVYGFAQGKIELEDETKPATGAIFGGCRLEASVFNSFVKDGAVTLVLDKNHARWETAHAIAEQINLLDDTADAQGAVAQALDQVNIRVRVPAHYQTNPVQFVSFLLNERVVITFQEARVVINERAGTIVIGEEVEIAPVAVSHKNMVLETGAPGSEAFVGVDSSTTGGNTRLTALVEALNAVKVPTEDVIEIIKGLDRNGALFGKLITE